MAWRVRRSGTFAARCRRCRQREAFRWQAAERCRGAPRRRVQQALARRRASRDRGHRGDEVFDQRRDFLARQQCVEGEAARRVDMQGASFDMRRDSVALRAGAAGWLFRGSAHHRVCMDAHFFVVRRHPCRATVKRRSRVARMPAHACGHAMPLRIAPVGKGAMRSATLHRGPRGEAARWCAPREGHSAMCATSRSTVKKHCEKHACRLHITKVFVYFTSLKTRVFASSVFRVSLEAAIPEKAKSAIKHRGKEQQDKSSHRYARQPHG